MSFDDFFFVCCKQKTAYEMRISDWSSDVCSSDLGGVVALLLTSMHMTLLGALITLAPRSLYHHDMGSALADQQVAGMVMLSGSMSYLAGGLWLVARLLREDRRRVPLR